MKSWQFLKKLNVKLQRDPLPENIFKQKRVQHVRSCTFARAPCGSDRNIRDGVMSHPAGRVHAPERRLGVRRKQVRAHGAAQVGPGDIRGARAARPTGHTLYVQQMSKRDRFARTRDQRCGLQETGEGPVTADGHRLAFWGMKRSRIRGDVCTASRGF